MSDDRARFVHLHVHTQYSLLRGAIRPKDLCQAAADQNMPAVAITDTNNLFGAIDFYTQAKSKGIKPILGCEIYYATDGYFRTGAPKPKIAQDFKPNHFHLVVLCKSYKGYQNLCRMITEASQAAPPDISPIVDRKLLDQYGDDLIIISGCIKGETAYQILQQQSDKAEENLLWFQKRFKDDFYLELQDRQMPEQAQVNDALYHLGKKLKIECVATADCHYLSPEDAEAHEVLQCIEQNKNLDFDRPKSLVAAENYFKSADQMIESFSAYPGVCENTLKIAEKCNVEFRFKDEEGKPIYHLPDFRPEGRENDSSFDLNTYFQEVSREGLRKRFEELQFREKTKQPNWKEQKKHYEDRLEREMKIIVQTGFAGYFLIVSDFILWAKRNKIPVGPGRGSGAGSIVAYSLFITDIDPIEFHLLFERFLNPERISMPDFDIDFCQERRGEVIEYVTQKYGKENVCQIITFGKLQTRAVIKDVGRVLGMTFSETDPITKLVPDELGISLSEALEKEPRIRDMMEQDPRIDKLMEYALKLEGLFRNAGVHAAGVIITNHPVVTYCPLWVGSEGSTVTQFDKDFAEKIGLVKFDFLGLKTLTVIDKAIRLINENSEKEFDFQAISLRDPKVFELVGEGDTDGVFQVESSGMKDLCTRLKPSSIEDLTAISALYRPGPLGSGMVDEFVERKHGRKSIDYELPQLEPILKDTYGVILYQEQVMQIARDLAGYSLGQADMLRRAMGKKKAEEMQRHKDIFLKGAKERDIPSDKAERIYDLMAKFAEYGFNKSHSAAYAMITYQTAYLKAHHSAEFSAALMTTEMNSTDKITKYINDAKKHAIPVLPPDVNRSLKDFHVEKTETGKGKKAVRFGLEAIKGVGGIAVECIIEARRGEKGEFQNILDFCRRVSTRKVNKKVWESLVHAGAFDSISEVNRATLFGSIEALLSHGTDEQEERELGQSSLFDSFSAETMKEFTPTDAIFKETADWSYSQKLQNEKKVVGFYVSGHPMDSWQSICEKWLGWDTDRIWHYLAKTIERREALGAAGQAQQQPSWGQGGYQGRPKKEIQIAGLLTDFREVTAKRGRNIGKRMAFGFLEDLKGRVEVALFPDAFEQLGQALQQALAHAEPVIVKGNLDTRDDIPKIIPSHFQWVREAYKNKTHHIVLQLNPAEVSADQLRELKKNLVENRGNSPVSIEFSHEKFKTNMNLAGDLKVEFSPQLVQRLNQIFGTHVVDLR